MRVLVFSIMCLVFFQLGKAQSNNCQYDTIDVYLAKEICTDSTIMNCWVDDIFSFKHYLIFSNELSYDSLLILPFSSRHSVFLDSCLTTESDVRGISREHLDTIEGYLDSIDYVVLNDKKQEKWLNKQRNQVKMFNAGLSYDDSRFPSRLLNVPSMRMFKIIKVRIVILKASKAYHRKVLFSTGVNKYREIEMDGFSLVDILSMSPPLSQVLDL